jgi:hypothetical protein
VVVLPITFPVWRTGLFFLVICQTRALATTVGQVIKHIQKGLIATRKQLDLSWPFPATSLKTMMN